MTEVVSIRLDKDILRYADEISREERIPKTAAIRKLLSLGMEYSRKLKAINLYREQKISLGKAAKIAGVSVWEMMDILVKFGIKSNITYEDYKKGLETARKIWK